MLIAAAVVLGLAAALFMGSLLRRDAQRLEAAPDRIQTEMDRLDAQIRDAGRDR